MAAIAVCVRGIAGDRLGLRRGDDVTHLPFQRDRFGAARIGGDLRHVGVGDVRPAVARGDFEALAVAMRIWPNTASRRRSAPPWRWAAIDATDPRPVAVVVFGVALVLEAHGHALRRRHRHFAVGDRLDGMRSLSNSDAAWWRQVHDSEVESSAAKVCAGSAAEATDEVPPARATIGAAWLRADSETPPAAVVGPDSFAQPATRPMPAKTASVSKLVRISTALPC
jgi:hypothetical protein